MVINHSDGTLYGMYDAADLIAYLRTLGEAGYDTFEKMLNRDDERAKDWLTRLPGFVSSKRAVTGETSKRDALQAMEDLKLDSFCNRFHQALHRYSETREVNHQLDFGSDQEAFRRAIDWRKVA